MSGVLVQCRVFSPDIILFLSFNGILIPYRVLSPDIIFYSTFEIVLRMFCGWANVSDHKT